MKMEDARQYFLNASEADDVHVGRIQTWHETTKETGLSAYSVGTTINVYQRHVPRKQGQKYLHVGQAAKG